MDGEFQVVIGIAWAAGLYEGEGSCVCQRAPANPQTSIERTGSVSLRVQSCDLDVLERFHAVVGVGTIRGPYKKPGVDHKPFWRWQCGREEDVIATLRAFWPYLGKRRQEQVWEAIGKRGIPPENSRRDWQRTA